MALGNHVMLGRGSSSLQEECLHKCDKYDFQE